MYSSSTNPTSKERAFRLEEIELALIRFDDLDIPRANNCVAKSLDSDNIGAVRSKRSY